MFSNHNSVRLAEISIQVEAMKRSSSSNWSKVEVRPHWRNQKGSWKKQKLITNRKFHLPAEDEPKCQQPNNDDTGRRLKTETFIFRLLPEVQTHGEYLFIFFYTLNHSHTLTCILPYPKFELYGIYFRFICCGCI